MKNLEGTQEFVLELSTGQQGEITDKCGFNPRAISTNVLALTKLSMFATAMEFEALPLTKDFARVASQIQGRNNKDVRDRFVVELNLEPAQTSEIFTLTGKIWTKIGFFPDEYEIQYFEPAKPAHQGDPIGQRFVVQSRKFAEDFDAKIPVILLPNDSRTFGTGQHPTTCAVIALMERFCLADDKLLDVGTGTGVLSIVAVKLGARSVTAIDIDEDAIKLAERNFEENDVSDSIVSFAGGIEVVEGTFSMIVANIFSPVVIRYAKRFHEILETDGRLIVSGVTEFRADEVRQAIVDCGLVHIETVTSSGWAAMVFQKVIR